MNEPMLSPDDFVKLTQFHKKYESFGADTLTTIICKIQSEILKRKSVKASDNFVLNYQGLLRKYTQQYLKEHKEIDMDYITQRAYVDVLKDYYKYLPYNQDG